MRSKPKADYFLKTLNQHRIEEEKTRQQIVQTRVKTIQQVWKNKIKTEL
jgi:hypothetical protein